MYPSSITSLRELNHTEAFDIPMAQRDMRSNVIILLEKCGFFLCFKAESHCVCILILCVWLLFSYFCHYFKIYTEHRIINTEMTKILNMHVSTGYSGGRIAVSGELGCARLTMPVTHLSTLRVLLSICGRGNNRARQEAGWELEEGQSLYKSHIVPTHGESFVDVKLLY